MNAENLIGIVIVIVVLFFAFRVGAMLMKLLLGLVAIAVVVWLVSNLFAGQPAPAF